MNRILAMIAVGVAIGCGSPQDQVPAEPEKAARVIEEVRDETHRFHKVGLIGAKVVETNLGGKEFMPGGNLAEYEQDGKTYQVLFTQRRNADQAMVLLMDYKDILEDSKFVPHYGGFFGTDSGTPTLIFQKNRYVVVVRGLDLEAADQAGRMIAGHLN